MYCLALTPPFFHSLPSSQFLYGKLCEFVTRYSLAAIHLKNDASYYFKKTFTLFQGYTVKGLLHKEGIYGHLCNFFILECWRHILFQYRKCFASHIQQELDILQVQRFSFWTLSSTTQDTFLRRSPVCFGHLSRIIKEETGQTIHAHITKLLYTEAKKMLSCSKYDIQTITDTLGFADQASFSKFFKRLAGASPKEYRNNLNCR